MTRPILWHALSWLAFVRSVRSEIDIPRFAMISAHWAGVFARSIRVGLSMTSYASVE